MKITVCMAAYNGEKYIEQQLQSILSQIGLDDNIVIVNDCSIDKTLKIIHQIKDIRITVINNEINIGVVKSFEKSMAHASGEIIFLSDQDDIWMPTKVKSFLEIFNSYPDITLALSDAQIIDNEDRTTARSYFNLRGKFNNGLLNNVIKNKYHGCTMAFRREILAVALPFPRDIPMHDLWIGIVNSIYGKTFYIDAPLIQHRRHNNNTGHGYKSSGDLFSILKWRLTLAKNIVQLILKKAKARNI
jgi:glycosyltransferase involved in cell wall biosynthesis